MKICLLSWNVLHLNGKSISESLVKCMLSAGLCIYTHAPRNTVSFLWSFLWLGWLQSWSDCETGMQYRWLDGSFFDSASLSKNSSCVSIWTCVQIDIRKHQDIHSRSSIRILEAQPNLYSAIIGEKVCMKIGDSSWCPTGREWTLATCGHRYAIWHK